MYKLTAMWGNHEGSLLLIIWMIILCGCIWLKVNLNNKISFSILFLIISIFLTYMLSTSNPFKTNEDIFKLGSGFNPLLQDIGIAIHPPILYLGNALQAIIFCLNLAGKHIERQQIYQLNKISWCFLTLGIGLGSWWAYRELGWGGIWFWDPVENISLLPWITSTILLHTRSGQKLISNITGSLGFLSFLYGMFIVRSGLISSIHSFAYDFEKGIFLLGIFLFFTIITLFILTKQKYSSNNKLTFQNSGLIMGNILLLFSFIIIIISIFFPIFTKLSTTKEISLENQFFIMSLGPLATAILLLAGIYANFLNKKIIYISLIHFSIALILTIIINKIEPIRSNILNLIIISSIFMIISYLVKFININKKNISMIIGHLSLGFLLLSICLYSGWEYSKTVAIDTNHPHIINNFQIHLQSIDYKKTANYFSRVANIVITDNTNSYNLAPELRFYPVEKSFTVESAVKSYMVVNNIYVTIGEINDNKLILEFKYQPFINLIWASIIILACSCVVSYVNELRRTNDDRR
jgi:cytochrome c-type biogenesis protein CcmF